MSDKPTKDQVKFTSDTLEYWQTILCEAASSATKDAPGMKSIIMALMIVAAADIAAQNGMPVERIYEAVDMAASRKRNKPEQRDKRIN